jgi:peptide/nickel transport system permease protein
MIENKISSPNQKAMQRLWRNRPAVFGLVVIVFCLLIAVLGYLITPDKSPDANEQVSEVALKQPGFSVTMLRVAKNKASENQSFFSAMLFGKQNAYENIPISNYLFSDNFIHVYTYLGDTLAYSLPDVVSAVSIKGLNMQNTDNQNIRYNDFENKTCILNIKEAQEQIKRAHIFQKTYYLGTDKFGRCMLSRLLIGIRISLLVGLIAVVISLLIGVTLGALAGFYGGKTDDFILLLINVIWSIPTVLLVFAIVLALGRGIGNIFLAVGLTMWVEVARLVRGQVMTLRTVQFVEAAQSFGYSTMRIIFKHLLPNILGPVMVIAASNFATAILLEAGLSYLGFGIRPPTPSWGTMLNETYGYAISGKPILALIPAFAIMLLVLSFNLLGNGIRDALDVKSKG